MKISMKDYQHNAYDSGEYIINRDYCCYETKQPTVEANSCISERIYISPFFIKTIISEDADYISNG